MADVDYKEIIHRCFRCGFCKLSYDYSSVGFNCPMYHRFRLETYSPSGLNWLIRAALIKNDIEWTEHLSEILYSCSTCGNCVETCRFEFGEHLVNNFIAVREEILETQRPVPKMIRKFFENVYLYGNAYREPREARGNWAQGLGIKEFEQGDEYLFYVGCVGSYDTCSQRAAKSLGKVMQKASVSFGILGEKEECDGNEVRLLGEQGLFEHQRDKNVELFREAGVKKIVTLSPHSYNAFKNHYAGEFEVFHYTQLLRDLIESGTLAISGKFEATVTYHDPCFLGRHNLEYDAPREVLNTIGGLNLVEMERNRKNAFCCGGGSANFYTGISAKGKDQASNARVREAYETGATILAVACPVCLLMLEDAVKTEGLDEQIQVKDISEIMMESLTN
ncbi:MAG: (Fe-S)-binding protein [Chloroflexi bacterium]|nr:(Fe-S)-binding protein [Chloroflexota bacterium]